MISHPKSDLALINSAGFLRSFGVGLMGVVLGIYLFRSGLSSTAIGFIIALGLAGSASATVLMTIAADRIGRKRFLVLISLLSAVGGLALVLSPSLPVLAAMAFIGMLNGTGTDRSAAFALDQAIVPGLVSDVRRTWDSLGTTYFWTVEDHWEHWGQVCRSCFSTICLSRFSHRIDSCSLDTPFSAPW